MKKLIFVLLLIFQINAFTQVPAVLYDYGMNCENLYRYRSGESFPVVSWGQGSNGTNSVITNFNGEYQIFDAGDYSYITIEAVSFPFMPDFSELGHTPQRNCVVLDLNSNAFSDNVINDMAGPYGLSENLYTYMPSYIPPQMRMEYISYTYGSNSYTWNTPVYTRISQKEGSYNFGPCSIESGRNAASTLISDFFGGNHTSPSIPVNTQRVILPHTVLKHTFWDNTGNSYSFIIDHTRGILRSYPFVNCGVPTGINPITYDLTLTHNAPASQEGCSYVGYAAHIYGDSTNYIYPTGTGTDDNVISFSIHGIDGASGNAYPAGYQVGTSTLQTIASNPCYHKYYIDKSIDLTKINPIEKVIYNPSEAIVKNGVSLLFPSCYIFRTVRSTYPKSSDMAMFDPNNPNGWNTIHNGGPYHDLREIPIPTDLGSATDPSDSSVYIIENGASITLQDGVTVYDCTFKVKPGGSIINYDSKEVAGRFKIQWLDGSNNVVSTFTLHRGRVQKQLIELNNLTIDADVIFEADIIRAGDNVGVYVTPGGNRVVTFKGVNEVKLGANFQAKPRGNGTFYSYTGNRCNRNTSAKY